MARAKRTERAEARRRYRAEQVEQAEQAATAAAVAAPSVPQQPVAMADRVRALLRQVRPPDVGADLRAVPAMVRAKPLILAPYGLLVLGAVVAAVLPKSGTSSGGIPYFYVQLAFLQPTLLFFAAGFLAPRAAYLFGTLLGVAAAVLFAVLSISLVGVFGSLSTMTVSDRVVYSLWQLLQFVVSGAIFGWFASWYRDFLRRSQARNRESAEARKRAQRRESRRQEAKRAR